MLRVGTILIILCLVISDVNSQVEIGVWTEQSTYQVGDTIAVHITAQNPTKNPIVLQFGTSCQASYKLDDFDLKHIQMCTLLLTSRVVPPLTTVSWDYLKYPDFGWPLPQLDPGLHTLIGEVIGYGVSTPAQIMIEPVTSVSAEQRTITDFQLGDNYPSPFNGSTQLTYSVSTPGEIQLGIYDALGRQVRLLVEGYSPMGVYNLTIDLADQPSGVYWCRFQHNENIQTTKLLLSK